MKTLYIEENISSSTSILNGLQNIAKHKSADDMWFSPEQWAEAIRNKIFIELEGKDE